MRKGACWFDSNEVAHSTLPACQAAELGVLGFDPEIAGKMIANAGKIINILDMGPKSRPGARKLNGAKRQKRVKPEPFSLPGTGVTAPEKPF